MITLLRFMGRFRGDRRGNVAITFAIALLPILAAVGCVMDYSLATRVKAKLQSAADAASVASISKTSPAFIAASAMTTDGPVVAGNVDAANVFSGNLNGVTGYTGLVPTISVSKSGTTLTSNVQFTANVPVVFLKVLGFTNLTVTGTSVSSASLPAYLDFYVALDVSGSMGLPSTTAEAQRLQYLNPDNFIQYPTGCTLACHFAPQNSACTDTGTQGYPTNGYCLGYAISRVSVSGFKGLRQLQSPQGKYPFKDNDPSSTTNGKYLQLPSSMISGLPASLYAALPPVSSCPTAGTDNCIQLRLDAVGFALNATQATNGVNGLLATANAKEIVPYQFRIGLYPFITKMNTSYSPLTAAINASPSIPGTINYAAANLATLLDTNMDSNLGSGGTHIDQGLHDLNAVISTVGTGGSSINTKPYVFLITDGAQDPQTKGVPNGSWAGSNHAVTLDNAANSYPTICSTLKARGITVSVLYIPYQPISPVNSSFAGDEDDYANWNIPAIPTSLQNCASPADAAGSYFYTANSPSDITAALTAMFNHSVTTAHITN